jgi:MFS family permease
MTAREARNLWLASLGGALEFYDFVIFVFFTAVIGRLFFPPAMSDWMRQLLTFGIFAVGYLARPLGGIVMAHFGDTLGRKRVFTLSILLMAVPTLLIGFLPTFHAIGIAAPLLLVAMRILQGVAIGGEAPGGWVFVAEHAPPGRSGFAIGLLTAGLTGGIFLGSLVATLVTLNFKPAQLDAGYWRVPFLIGGVFGFCALALRRKLSETPVFEEIRSRAAGARELPVRAVLRNHVRAIVTSVMTTLTLTGGVLVVILMTPTLLPKLFHLNPLAVQEANLAAAAALSVAVVLAGAATDRFGVRAVAVVMSLAFVAGAYGLYFGAERRPSALMPLYVLAGLGTGVCVITPILMVRAFPALVRFTGVSFSYNIAYAVFGGVTPPFVAWLAHEDRYSPAHYILFVAIVGLVAAFAAPEAEKRTA